MNTFKTSVDPLFSALSPERVGYALPELPSALKTKVGNVVADRLSDAWTAFDANEQALLNTLAAAHNAAVFASLHI